MPYTQLTLIGFNTMPIIQVRNDQATAWSEANPVLALGELGLDTDTFKLKIGDGVTAWNSLTSPLLSSGDKGVANGVASLTSAGKLPSSQLPTHSHPISTVGQSYDLVTGSLDPLNPSEELVRCVSPRTFKLYLVGAVAKVKVPATTTQVVIDVVLNDATVIATVTFPIGDYNGTVAFTGGTPTKDIAIGDVISIKTRAGVDGAFLNWNMSILGLLS